MVPLRDLKNVHPLVKTLFEEQIKAVFPKQFAEDNRRSCYLRNGERQFSRFPKKFLLNQENSKCKVESSTGNISGTRN